MQKVISLLKLIPGFRSPGHPIRKVVVSLIYSFIALVILVIVFGPPTFTLASNQISSESDSARISGHTTDVNSEILLIQNGQTITKAKPDTQTKDFYFDLTSLSLGTNSYEVMACSIKKSDNCSPRQSVTVTTGSVIPVSTITIATSSPTLVLQDVVLVTNVIDGDTFTIEGGKVVRMIGMDTPETVHPSKPIQCYGKEASVKTTELIEGQKVRLEKDVSETDQYKRLLRYVWKGDVLINELLVKDGFAESSTYPPDVKYQDRFIAAQKEARDNKRGLWSSVCDNPVSPTTAQISPNTGGSYVCNCSKTCPNMSCAEAQYQLKVCGCSKRDADEDGFACDSQCQ